MFLKGKILPHIKELREKRQAITYCPTVWEDYDDPVDLVLSSCGNTYLAIKNLLHLQKISDSEEFPRQWNRKKVYVINLQVFNDNVLAFLPNGVPMGPDHTLSLIYDNGWVMIDAYMGSRLPTFKRVKNLENFIKKLNELKDYTHDAWESLFRCRLSKLERRRDNLVRTDFWIEEYVITH